MGTIRVAECLQHYGIRAGDSVAVYCENRFEVPYIMFAVYFIGATYIPLNPTYTDSACACTINVSELTSRLVLGELLHVCSFSHPRIIFASHLTLERVKHLVDQTVFVEKVFLLGDEIVGSDFGNYNNFIRNELVPSHSSFVCPPQNMKENIALIFCSSGTTGNRNVHQHGTIVRINDNAIA